MKKQAYTCEMIRDLLPLYVEHLTSPETAVKEVPDGSIDFEKVSFRYSETAQIDALQNVTLHIPSGATVGILGVTGSSKTTLVQLIPRLYDVSDGCLKVGGIDVRKLDLTFLRRNIGVVSQETYLFNGTIRDNLLYAKPEASEEELSQVPGMNRKAARSVREYFALEAGTTA